MSSLFDTLGLDMPSETDTGKTRLAVLKSLPWQPTPTSSVSYVSSNRVLVIADEVTGISIIERLPERMQCFLAIPAGLTTPITKSTDIAAAESPNLSGSSKESWKVSGLQIEGYLGRYHATVSQNLSIGTENAAPNRHDLGKLMGIANGLFDQVIDATAASHLSATVTPPGFYYVGQNAELQDNAIAEVPELIGEFEKPKYFSYNAEICAHGRSGIPGCNNCIDACPTEAIISIGEKIEVNPHLCQGGGSCTSSCPTGAITYNYPLAAEQLELLRKLVKSLRDQNAQTGISLLVFDQEHGQEDVELAISQLPETVIPFVVEDIGSVGLDFISLAIVYGVSSLTLYVPASVPKQEVAVLEKHEILINSVFEQLNYSDGRVRIVSQLQPEDFAEPSASTSNTAGSSLTKVATFAPMGDKRAIIRAALGHAHAMMPAEENSVEFVTLPQGSLFGQVKVNQEACTLCMACVSVCPVKALQDGAGMPALRFIETNCVQCGICEAACPEQAIAIESRLHFDRKLVNEARELNAEKPFHCIDCGKAFATEAMIKKITGKLKAHWMFDKPEALTRLQMCEDCRVKDMFDKA